MQGGRMAGAPGPALPRSSGWAACVRVVCVSGRGRGPGREERARVARCGARQARARASSRKPRYVKTSVKRMPTGAR